MHGSAARAPWLVWLGGAAFVASLALFAYHYYVVFGRPAPTASLLRPVLIDTVLFTIFALHHSVLARSSVKRLVVARVPAHLERSLYVWVASALFAIVCLAWQPVSGTLYVSRGWLALPHWLVVSAGAWLTARSAAALDPLDLAGIRQARRDQTPSAFTVAWPYTMVRHPIYSGLVVAATGYALLRTSIPSLILSLVLGVFFDQKARREERWLEARYPGYGDYRRRVRGRIIPR